jgi:hypothetical protein
VTLIVFLCVTEKNEYLEEEEAIIGACIAHLGIITTSVNKT